MTRIEKPGIANWIARRLVSIAVALTALAIAVLSVFLMTIVLGWTGLQNWTHSGEPLNGAYRLFQIAVALPIFFVTLRALDKRIGAGTKYQ
ncbi:hypothetical protein [Croceicoccus sp. Ery5]|uniref:hypothetical protein n=1 Tax=Croceicoccus sp. Ery5 TaxID=1703340 RepID=UPI001E57FE7D|nr:hypothetical protein [Croceicoccus sp. Ery5]